MRRTLSRLAAPTGLVAIAVALVSAYGAGSGGAPDARAQAEAQQTASGLTPGRLAGQRIVTGFEGREPPRPVRRMIAAGRVAGVILFSDNVGGRRAVRRLARKLQSIKRPPGLRRPLLVMADQEGGLVRRLPGPPKPAADVVGQRGAKSAGKLGAATGKSMRDMGVNVNLAPVFDVARRGGFIEEQRRAYARRADRVGRIASAFARGMERNGVAATGKHFPGLGMATGNTDLRPVTLRTPRRTLRNVDEAAYTPFLAGGGEMVMLSMARYSAYGGGPAALSRAIATRELRGRIGFRGVSISDALGTPSAASVGPTGKVALRGAGAGTDLLLYSDPGQAAAAHRALKRALIGGRLARGWFERSVTRVLDLRARLGRGDVG